MWTAMWFATALAAPVAVRLVGAEGALVWSMDQRGEERVIDGSSPKWRVHHVANADWTPRRTEHWAPDGTLTVIEYAAWGATIRRGDAVWERRQAGLWDGDTLDLRLGSEVAAGHTSFQFSGLDPASGKVYGFDTQKVGDEACGAARCVHVRVQLSGVLRYVGPTWDYWYDATGALLRFEGPAGSFTRGAP